MVVTVLLTGMPHGINLHDIAYFLDKLFDTDDISTFHARTLPMHKRTRKRQIALDFKSGFDAITAQEILDGYIYVYKDTEFILHAKVTQKKEHIAGKPSYFDDDREEKDLQKTCKRFNHSPHRDQHRKRLWLKEDSHSHTSYEHSSKTNRKKPPVTDSFRYSQREMYDAHERFRHWSHEINYYDYYDYKNYEINESDYDTLDYETEKHTVESTVYEKPNNDKEKSRKHGKNQNNFDTCKNENGDPNFDPLHDNLQLNDSDRIHEDATKLRINEAIQEVFTEMESKINKKDDTVVKKLKEIIGIRINAIKPIGSMLVNNIVMCYRSVYPKSKDKDLIKGISDGSLNEKNTDNQVVEIENEQVIDKIISDDETWQLIDEVLEDFKTD